VDISIETIVNLCDYTVSVEKKDIETSIEESISKYEWRSFRKNLIEKFGLVYDKYINLADPLCIAPEDALESEALKEFVVHCLAICYLRFQIEKYELAA